MAAAFTLPTRRCGATTRPSPTSRVERATKTPKISCRQVRRFRRSQRGPRSLSLSLWSASCSKSRRSAAKRVRPRSATLICIGVTSHGTSCKIRGALLLSRPTFSWNWRQKLQFQENSTEREQLGQRLIAGCQQQPRGRNAALCAIRLRSNATDHGRVHRLSSCMTGSMLSKRPSLAPRKDLLELEMSELVRLTQNDGVAVITIDNPPVNALSSGVPEGIAESIRAAAQDPAVNAVVVIGAGRTFIAGADIKDLAAGKEGPDMHALLKSIEDCPKPVVMALHGTALGGGLEVAMAGHYRLAVASAQVGQPEVNLGIIPGAEGTQRLTRL